MDIVIPLSSGGECWGMSLLLHCPWRGIGKQGESESYSLFMQQTVGP